MKFSLLLFLSTLTLAANQGFIALDSDLSIAEADAQAVDSITGAITSGDLRAALACPSGYPLLCPNGQCCPLGYNRCCPGFCCPSAYPYCGSDRRCYK